MTANDEGSDPSSRARLLGIARAEFAELGFDGARLAEIARQAGVTHPTLLYHFNSKANLYQAVIDAEILDWALETESALSTVLRGFEQVRSLLDAAFTFFECHRDFARILRREAMQGGERLEPAMEASLRPLLARATAFLEREMHAGRLRRQDPLELMQVCYGSVFGYFSDADFRRRLLGEDPLSSSALARHRQALTELLRAALEPADTPIAPMRAG